MIKAGVILTRPSNLRWLTLSYVLLLSVIIYLADNDYCRRVFSFIRSVPGGDKTGHFLLIGTLALFINLCLPSREVKINRISFRAGSLIVFIAVTLEEFSQIFIRSRSFDLADLFADYLGICLFGVIANRLRAKQRTSS